MAPVAPRAMLRQFPPTPPDFVPYNATNTKGSGSHGSFQPSWPTPGIVGHEEISYAAADHYAQGTASLQPPVQEQYHDSGHFHDPANRLAPLIGYHERTGAPMGAPLLPPMQVMHQPPAGPLHGAQSGASHGMRADEGQDLQQPKADTRGGGISAELDYDMNQMTDFVAEMAQGLYALLASRIYMKDIDIIGSIKPNSTVSTSFRNWVSQVLRATRLPSATILAAFHYLTARMTVISGSKRFEPSDGVIYRMLTVALLLGSKFLDDNTFHSQSWADVSGIAFKELKTLEREWLQAMGWRLHFDPDEENGFNHWQRLWVGYQHRAQLRTARSVQLTPIDTNVNLQQSLQSAYSATSFGSQRLSSTFPHHGTAPQQQYSSNFAFNPWFGPQSANTPPSAMDAHSAHPNYIGDSGTWATPTRWSQEQPQHQQQPQQSAALYSQQSGYGSRWNNQNIWSGHNPGYQSMFAVSRPPLSYFNPAYRMQSVMG
ncbi:MAG: hypothetical protein M1822_001011 [Bathelium mastoideum]|nr:MAG: hypothetical protein M1822_001011 [Bathelium mastoideum]